MTLPEVRGAGPHRRPWRWGGARENHVTALRPPRREAGGRGAQLKAASPAGSHTRACSQKKRGERCLQRMRQGGRRRQMGIQENVGYGLTMETGWWAQEVPYILVSTFACV